MVSNEKTFPDLHHGEGWEGKTRQVLQEIPMPQLRQDPTTKEWVIIAAERSKRPHDFIKTKTLIEKPPYKEDCPFCPGNEHLTPHESLAYRSGGPADSKGWWVRVIPNKFPALSPEGSWERKEEKGFFRMMDGMGIHEVVIESPIHNQLLPLMEDKQVEEVLLAYRERYLALREDPRIKLIIVFKNHGEAAGTSLDHTHSQLVGTAVVPSNIRKKLEEAARYYDDHGRCVYCDSIQRGTEVREEDRDGYRKICCPPTLCLPVSLRNLDRSQRASGLFRFNLHGGFKKICKGLKDNLIETLFQTEQSRL